MLIKEREFFNILTIENPHESQTFLSTNRGFQYTPTFRMNFLSSLNITI